MEATRKVKKNLSIAHWNANGILNKQHELPYFLHKHNIDIFLINETKTIHTDNIYIKGYTCYRKDRQDGNRGGGVALLIKNAIPHQEFPINSPLEAHAIKVSDILIISCYIPPQNNINIKEIDRLLKLNNKVILAGDLNAKHKNWNCSKNNKSGNILNNFITKNPIIIKYPDTYTLYPTNSTNPSIVDIAIIKNIDSNINTTTLDELDSDHKPVLFKLNNKNIELVTPDTLNYKKADWNKFRKILTAETKINNKIKSINDIDNIINTLTKNIQTAIAHSIPKIKGSNKDNIPEFITNMIKLRNSTNRKYQRTRNTIYKTRKNQLTHEIRWEINKYHNTNLENKLKTLNTKDNTLWNAIKMKKYKDNTIPTLHGPNGLVSSNEEKAETIADIFERVHYLTQDFSDKTTERTVNREFTFIQHTQINTDNIKPVTAKEIKTLLKKLKPKKAPGLDGIQNIILKNLPKKAIAQLIYIFNACLKTSYFPDAWKKAKILPFKKPGKDPKFPQNYRPISLLPTLAKLLEMIINNRLNKFLDDNNIITPEQFGFRQKHYTVQQLARLTDHISTNFNKKKNTGLLLLDIEKAFDTVWTKGLIYKLNNIDTPLYITKIISNYLTNRTFTIQVKNNQSTYRNIVAGVPQGSILGPKLFLIYINDLPKNVKTNIALFADDTAIYSSSGSKEILANNIQRHITDLEEYYNKWKIKINVNKTELIIHSHKRNKLTNIIKLYDENINVTNQAKYLGLILDKKLNYSQHTASIHKKANAAISILYPLLKNTYTSTHNKLLIYKACIRPIIMYAAPVWGNTCKSNYKKLQTIQNKCLKMALNVDKRTSTKLIHDTLKVPTIKEYILEHTKKFYNEKLNNIEILKNTCKKINKTTWDKYKLPQEIILV